MDGRSLEKSMPKSSKLHRPEEVTGNKSKCDGGLRDEGAGSEAEELPAEMNFPLSFCCYAGYAPEDNDDSDIAINTSDAATHAPKAPRRLITAEEAYNKGAFLQYIVSRASRMTLCGYRDCPGDCVDYETRWNGHQPLASPAEDDDSDIVPASEQRLRRSRRRRGVVKNERTNCCSPLPWHATE